jgi:hypothetical protein
VSISHGSLAESLDISKGSIIESIAGQKVHAIDNVSNLLRSNLGNKIEITWYDETGKKITRSVILPTLEKGGILGASIKNKPNVAHDSFYALEKYKSFFGSNPMILLLPMPSMAQELVPYSDLMAPRYESSVLGSSFPIFATMLFWLWYINFYVGIFNALPIGPLDGGQLYNSFIKTKTKSLSSTRTNIITIALTVIMITIIIMSILLPWIIL